MKSATNNPKDHRLGLRVLGYWVLIFFVYWIINLILGVIPNWSMTHLALERTIKDFLINNTGWSEKIYETSWGCFEDYLKEFQNPIHQHAVYSIVSHWDWFISNLGKFIDFAERSISPEKQTDKDLLKLNFKPFTKQIEIIKNETGILLNIENNTLDLIEEMDLVRNLGMHNEWEVDGTYLKKTKKSCLKSGDKRVFEIPEITKWHSAYLQLIDALAYEIAVRYAQVPKYE